MSATKFTTDALTVAATAKVAAELAAGTKGHFLVSALKTFFGIGTTTNDSAAAGQIGEYIESSIASGNAVSLTTATAADVTSISLTAGDWDVWGQVSFLANGATTITRLDGWISTTSATFPTVPNGGALFGLRTTFETGIAQFFPVGMTRMSLSETTTVYLTARGSFGVNTLAAYGIIAARRVR